MFQYATARGLAGNAGKIYLDHSHLEKHNKDDEHFTARNFELHIFKKLKAGTLSKWKFKLLTGQSTYIKLCRLLFGFRTKVIEQQGNEYIPMDALPKDINVYLDGYFQSEKYFKHLSEQLVEEFSFPELDKHNQKIKQTIVDSPNSVSIHIRRGDYLRSAAVLNVHGVLPYSYYQKALGNLNSKFRELELFIFSEDMEWAKANFKGSNVHFLENNKSADSWKDMALMTYCKHHIIANSSFSWWAAWLSQNNGEVYAPVNWFNKQQVKYNIADFIPLDWKLIGND